jgi:hypothetical protein
MHTLPVRNLYPKREQNAEQNVWTCGKEVTGRQKIT